MAQLRQRITEKSRVPERALKSVQVIDCGKSLSVISIASRILSPLCPVCQALDKIGPKRERVMASPS